MFYLSTFLNKFLLLLCPFINVFSQLCFHLLKKQCVTWNEAIIRDIFFLLSAPYLNYPHCLIIIRLSFLQKQFKQTFELI